MEMVSYPMRIPSRLIELAELRAREEYVDKTTALKQLLYWGAEDYVLELLGKGKISTGKAGELLGRTVYEIQDKLREKGVTTGATLEQYAQARKNAKLLKTRK